MDPYRPPSSELPEPSAGSTKFRWLPVLVSGIGVDFLGSNVAGAAIAAVAAAVLTAQGVPEDGLAAAVPVSAAFLVPSYVVGLSLTLLGGYVAARWAAGRFVHHAAASGLASLLVGSPFLIAGSESLAWHSYLGILLQVPIAAAGGWLAARRFRRG